MTKDWFAWLDGRDPAHPFFGFLLFDASNAQQFPPGMPGLDALGPQGPGELAERFSDYRNVRYLEVRGLADNTVLVFTSDHGEEFDESGMGLRDHGSGYTPYQLQVPMVIGWPGKAPQRYVHRSSHYDVVPTLLQDVLGCTNSPETYSSGHNLFASTDWTWLLAGSYYNYAVLEPDQLTITFPNGRFEVRDWNYQLLDQPQIRGSVLESVARENSRFHR
jgi:membrane-anchored protein YejM (alkaline phosphatase superfamily)